MFYVKQCSFNYRVK